MNRWKIGLIIIATVAPGVARAQFTTFIAPPNKARDSIKAAVVAEAKVARDSATHAQIANMKSWVDSAAGVVVPTIPATDTAMTPPPIPMIPVAPTPTPPVPVNGVRAPNTASSLPELLLFGLLGLSAGALLLRAPRPPFVPQPRRLR
jgi:hypothetical protein